jgi:hypothetical protein
MSPISSPERGGSPGPAGGAVGGQVVPTAMFTPAVIVAVRAPAARSRSIPSSTSRTSARCVSLRSEVSAPEIGLLFSSQSHSCAPES